MKYLIIIPARGGSKGIPQKNIIDLNNIPLIGHTINAAKETASIIQNTRIIVSTDDEKIRKISQKLGAQVPFLRPKKLSGDLSPSIEYVNHALEFFLSKGEYPEHVIILQPTSPLRTSNDIVSSIELYEKHNDNSLISAYEDETINEKIMYKLSGNHGIPLSFSHNTGNRRQDDPAVLIRNGAIYITKVDYIKDNGCLVSERPLIFLMPKSRSINIDSPEDLVIAENSFN